MRRCPEPKLKRDWIGRKVRLTRTVRTHGGDVWRKGSVAVVAGYYRGFRLNRVRSRGWITRIQRDTVELLPMS